MIFALLLAVLAQQQPPAPQGPPPDTKALVDALTDANNSSPDIIRNLEAFLKKYPNYVSRSEIDRLLVRAAIETKDDRRIILYGERVLQFASDDMLVLDRVAHSLLAMGGEENAQKSLKYSRAFAEKIEAQPPAAGIDAARRQEERDRGESRALLYQSRAQAILGDKEDAERLASRAFSIYPNEESAREWGTALEALGRNKEAIEKYAQAFTISDSRASDADRADDRRHAAELFRKLHHNEKGLGDEILAAYDSTAALLEARHARLAALDPNFAATDPMQFHLAGLDGADLALSSLKGNVVVVDFWATWCVPCRAQHSLYDQVMQRFKDRKDVIFLSVDTDEDHQVVGSFIDQYHWNKKVYFESGLQRLLQINSIPTTLLFDKNGRISSRMNGYLPDKFADMLTDRIRTALAE